MRLFSKISAAPMPATGRRAPRRARTRLDIAAWPALCVVNRPPPNLNREAVDREQQSLSTKTIVSAHVHRVGGS